MTNPPTEHTPEIPGVSTVPTSLPDFDEAAFRETLQYMPEPEPIEGISDEAATRFAQQSFTARALPPEHRNEILRQVSMASPEAREGLEDHLVRAKMAEVAAPITRMRRMAEGNEVTREVLDIEAETAQLIRRRDIAVDDMVQVARYDTRRDENGVSQPHPIMALSKEAMNQRALEIVDIDRQLRTLGPDGPIAQRRIAAAAEKAVSLARKVHEQQQDALTIKRRADEMVREKRINDAATQRARILGNEVD